VVAVEVVVAVAIAVVVAVEVVVAVAVEVAVAFALLTSAAVSGNEPLPFSESFTWLSSAMSAARAPWSATR
jgi:hypothetical protein